MPADGEVGAASTRGGVIDIASKGHRDATDPRVEIWEKLTNIRFNKRYWAEDRLIERIIVTPIRSSLRSTLRKG